MGWSFFEERHQKAKKPHTCLLCNKQIKPNEQYIYRVGKYDGIFQQQYLHIACADMIDKYCEETGENEWDENVLDYFADELEEDE